MSIRRPRGRPITFENETAFRAATEILLREGAGRLTLIEVARRVGTTHQALRQRFISRDDFVLALFAWLRAIVEQEIRAIVESAPTPLDAARAIWTLPVSSRVVDCQRQEDQAAWFLLTIELRREPVIREKIPTYGVDRPSVFIELIRSAQQANQLIQVDPAEIDEAVGVAVTGAAIQWTIDSNEPLLTKMRRCRDRALNPFLQPTS